MNIKLLYLTLAAVTWFMTGLIWFVQIVHYPLFAQVGTDKFIEYARAHCNLTGMVVVAPMVIQLLLSLWLACTSTSSDAALLWINFSMVVAIWILTATCSIPCHNSLCNSGFSSVVHNQLVSMNWFRTILWSLCSLAVSTCIYKHLA